MAVGGRWHFLWSTAAMITVFSVGATPIEKGEKQAEKWGKKREGETDHQLCCPGNRSMETAGGFYSPGFLCLFFGVFF